MTYEQTGRYLGTSEEYFWLSDQRQAKQFAVAAEVEGVTATQDWQAALDRLQERHSLLRMRIAQDEDKRARFEEVLDAKISLHVVSNDDTRSWEQHVAEEMERPFNFGAGPLVRGRLLHQPDRSVVILIFQHAIADGLSGAYVLRDLLKAVSGEPLTALPLPQPQEAHLPGILMEKQAPANGQNSMSWPSGQNQNRSRAALSVNSFKIPKLQTYLLRKKCRAEGTTVHGALVAALILAGSQLSAQWKERPVRVISPVNNRSLLGIYDDCVVSIVFPVGNYAIADPSFFWDTARNVTQDLAPSRTREGLHQVFEAMRHLVTPSTRPTDIEEFERTFLALQLMASNLGVLPFGSHFGRLRLVSFWGPATLVGVEGEQVVGISTVNDQIHLLQTSFSPISGFLERAAQIVSSVIEV